jgi:hypothetical protein
MNSTAPGHAPNDDRVNARELRERIEAAIRRELERCERNMPPQQWRAHCAWIRANVVASAREWLHKASREGQL